MIKHATKQIGWFCEKRQYFKNELKENIAKSKDLWNTLKSLCLSKKFCVQMELKIINI